MCAHTQSLSRGFSAVHSGGVSCLSLCPHLQPVLGGCTTDPALWTLLSPPLLPRAARFTESAARRAPDAALRAMTQAGGVSNVLQSAHGGEYSSLARAAPVLVPTLPPSRAAAAWRGSHSSCPGRQRLDGIEVEGHRVRALQLSVAVDADEALRLLVKVVLERDDDELELALVGARADELCDARHVDVVERGVNLVHHEEGRRAVVVHRKQQRQRRQRALTT
mmetsp:Transcript_1337/g.4126  ORF Transcript_1337/g.4126 Transcript_1337/m.4126 type:complete len:222 (-) Transcript_1337:198-863(-)